MTYNRVFRNDEPPPYEDGPKELPVQYRHRHGPMLNPYHETIVTENEIVLASIGGQTKLEAAAVDVLVALIGRANPETVNKLVKDPRLQVGLGKAAATIASSVLTTAEGIETREPGDQGR